MAIIPFLLSRGDALKIFESLLKNLKDASAVAWVMVER